MRITVLGFQSPYPGPGGATPGYLLQTESLNLLVDCGSGVVSQLTKYIPIYQLDAIFLSHYHQDHIADIGVLQYGLHVHNRVEGIRPNQPLPIYAPTEPAEYSSKMVYKDATIFKPVFEQNEVTVGDITVSFIRTDHPILCYAIVFTYNGKKILYGADTGMKMKWEEFPEPDLFICEGTYLDGFEPNKPSGHLSVRQASQIAADIKAKSLLITHLFQNTKSEDVYEQASTYRGLCYVAEIGLQIEI
ncbi:MBL fold metallo-hydrolase [Brevibacterium sp. JNUCC-42]|nr:MBL fold metallo-hydrolase [Brevibacterium sp. JNUCC-42]